MPHARVLTLALLASLALGTACDRSINQRVYGEECDSFDWSDCEADFPSDGGLAIELSFGNRQENSVPLEVYRGRYDQGELLLRDTATESPWYVYVPLDEYYSVVAEYRVGQDTIYALDGDRIELYTTDVCGEKCWEIIGGHYKLAIRD